MIEIIIMEVISIVSYIFSVLLFLFKFESSGQIILLFTTIILVSLLTHYLSKRKKVFNVLYLLYFVPLIIYREKTILTFLSINAISMIIYNLSFLDKWTHYTYVRSLKKSLLIYIPLIYMRYLLSKYTMDLSEIAPFMVLYLITSITLARTFRHLDSNMDLTNIRKNNIKTLLVMPIIFLVSISSEVRAAITFFSNKLIDIIAYPVYMVAVWFENFISRFSKKGLETPSVGVEPNPITDNITSEESMLDFQQSLEKLDDNNLSLISTIFSVILIVIVIYIIYKLIIKSNKSFKKEITYTEEREYIKKEKASKTGGILRKDSMPKDFSGQIRYYYRRFLEKLEKKGIDILNTDSTLEINQKAEDLFNIELGNIRKIYIGIRYGKKEATKDMVEEIEKTYKKL